MTSESSSADWRAAWKQAAHLIGAKVHEGDSRAYRLAIQLRTGDHLITLISSAWNDGTGTELRAPFWNPRGIRFQLTPTPLATPLGFLFQRDVQIGDASLDPHYLIETASPDRTRDVLSDPRIRTILLELPRLELSVRPLPAGHDVSQEVDEIYVPFTHTSDVGRIRRSFELVKRVLKRISSHEIGDPVLEQIRRLEGPGGSVRVRLGSRGFLSIWDGDTARTRAAMALGGMRDSRALDPLIRALGDPSPEVRILSARALGKLGDRRAIDALIPMMGHRERNARSLRTAAREALAKLGAKSLVTAFDKALAGNPALLVAEAGPYRGPILEALVRSLTKPHQRAFSRAYHALAALRAGECLPVMRSKLREVTDEKIRVECEEAIAKLEALQSLPRSATSRADASTTLPRSATSSEDVSALPRRVTRRREADAT